MSGNSICLTGNSPSNLTDENLCNLGFLCPRNDLQHPPQFCPPTKQCQQTRLQLINNICSAPQGLYEPTICAPGHYCPLGGKQQFPCPKGHYCPTGSYSPTSCSWISLCPAGALSQRPTICLIILLVVDACLALCAVFPRVQRRLSRRKWVPNFFASAKQPAERHITFDSETGDVSPAWDAKSFGSLQDFIESSTKSIGLNSSRMEIGFDQLGLKIGKNGKEILHGVTGQVRPGSLLAVMGASGAGKTTFVRVLMGKVRATSGATSINGTHGNMSDFKKIIGYVPQDDVVLPELTVRENLLHSALIRLPTTWTFQEIEDHVDTLISCLHIQNIQHVLVGDTIKPVISGGQRKRVSIGIELAAAPMTLILDEPTSGLDATSALSIVNLLKALSKLGVTVICIIHQPRREIFMSLDRVLLLAAGRTVYLGETKKAADYFRSIGYNISMESNPADAIMDITSGHAQRYGGCSVSNLSQTIEALATRWVQHTENGNSVQTITRKTPEPAEGIQALVRSAASRGSPWCLQTYFCFRRSMIQQSRQPTGFVLEIIVGAISGLMIGLSVYNLNGKLFQGVYAPPFELLSSAVNYTLVPELGLLNSLAIGLAAAAPGVKTFGEEKTIYWREAASGHSRSAYYVGKVLSTIFRITLSALHFTVFYAMLATPMMPFGQLYAAHLLYFYCIYGLASCVSMIVSRENGPLLAMIVSLIIGVFGGYGPSLSTIKSWHLEWLWRVCPGTWFSEAYFHAHTLPLRHLYDISVAAKWTGYTPNQLYLDFVMLLVIGSFYRLLAYGGLVLMDREKQS